MKVSVNQKIFFGLVLLAGVAACSTRRPYSPPEGAVPLLTWLGEWTRPYGTKFPQLDGSLRFGGISGLAHDNSTGRWIGVVDDRDRSRVVWLDVVFRDKGLEITPLRMQELRAAPDVAEATVTRSDLEAIVSLPDGTFVLTEEGHRIAEPPGEWPPALLHMNREGVITSVTGFPKEFQLSADGVTGLRDNQGFESLAVTPRQHLIAGLEQPLLQDGNVTFDRGAAGRLVEFEPARPGYRYARQWRYMISPTPRIEGFDDICNDGENGLVELLALSDTHLIAMERACLITRDKQFIANAIQLFSVELVAGDARKRLLLDFNQVQPRLSPALSRLENFEGMTFGPLVDGRRTLLVVSDDNFRETQKTSFLLFGMR
ncbi:MAG TPA: esterase-like activity of phytase family protein [Vicinamibacterales bacterium]|nr:esterase-like activity of phytase family protein [Vicinamibacterales bacterium]